MMSEVSGLQEMTRLLIESRAKKSGLSLSSIFAKSLQGKAYRQAPSGPSKGRMAVIQAMSKRLIMDAYPLL